MRAARGMGTGGLTSYCRNQAIYKSSDVVQVNLAAESGEMGVLAQHVPSIEQLKPGIVEVIEESGTTKQFFRTSHPPRAWRIWSRCLQERPQSLVGLLLFSPTRF